MIDPKHPIRSDGTKLVVLRITNNQIRHYINLGLSVKPENWKETECRFKKSHNPLNYRELNHHLTDYLAKAETILSEFKVKNIPFSLDHFKDLLFGSNVAPGVMVFFDTTIETMKQRKEIGNADVYKHARNALKAYTHREDITFQEITPSLLEGFETHLTKSGCVGNTIHNYMRTIRALYNRAIKSGFASQEIYPFHNNYTHKGYDLKGLKKATSKRSLTQKELEIFKNYQPAELSMEEDAKLLFMFSYYTWGMNIVDILQLKWKENIREDHIIYSRIKTRRTKNFVVKITEPVREILNHFRNYTTGNNVFPFIADNVNDPVTIHTRTRTVTRQTNRVLKEIGAKLEIKTPLSTNVARHTFATTMKRKGEDTPVIQAMMGHPTETTTQIYLGEFGIDVLDEASEKLIL
jgi:site-specific recombinase XerD